MSLSMPSKIVKFINSYTTGYIQSNTLHCIKESQTLHDDIIETALTEQSSYHSHAKSMPVNALCDISRHQLPFLLYMTYCTHHLSCMLFVTCWTEHLPFPLPLASSQQFSYCHALYNSLTTCSHSLHATTAIPVCMQSKTAFPSLKQTPSHANSQWGYNRTKRTKQPKSPKSDEPAQSFQPSPLSYSLTYLSVSVLWLNLKICQKTAEMRPYHLVHHHYTDSNPLPHLTVTFCTLWAFNCLQTDDPGPT